MILCESFAANLFDEDIDLITVFHVEFLGGLSFMQSFAIEQKANVVGLQLRYEIVCTLCFWQ